MPSNSYIAVDLDGTLIEYESGSYKPGSIGRPVERMVQRVKQLLKEGTEVRILTARVSSINPFASLEKAAIEKWTKKIFGRVLPVTSEKDYKMTELWDDRARQVIANTGEFVVNTGKFSPTEDLMNEHGVLRRILMVYRHACTFEKLPYSPLIATTKLLLLFANAFHEKLEEEYIFPRCRQSSQFVELVELLTAQHQAGKQSAEYLLKALEDENSSRVRELLRGLSNMYEAHAVKEDTVLFPYFKAATPANVFSRIGIHFDMVEERLFGEGAFEKIVGKIQGIERDVQLPSLKWLTV